MRYLTAGESHGAALCAILEGMPSGLKLDIDKINEQLARRQGGYGRGGRMKIEKDKATVLSGVRGGVTLGSPIALVIPNADHENWKDEMSAFGEVKGERKLTKVRPGHADLAGSIKYGFDDARNVLERASARETAARVAVGAICRSFLENLGITVGSHVLEIGDIYSSAMLRRPPSVKKLKSADNSDVRCLDEGAAEKMRERIDLAREIGTTVGGRIEVVVSGMPVGIGSYVHYDRRLDAQISADVMSIPSVKLVQIGSIYPVFGNIYNDEIVLDGDTYRRTSNNAGGIEGGVSNGEDIIVRAKLKPIPTTMMGMATIDMATGKEAISAAERSDVCAVPAASVVAENVIAITLAKAILDAVGGDTMDEVKAAVEALRQKSKAAKRGADKQ